jgi:putative ABC transport system permease protein
MWSALWKISVRNILKHKGYSTMNIIGLALGFAAFILIGLFVQYELSWDKWNVKYDRIYRIQRHYVKTLYAMDGNDISPHSRPITAQLLERRFPEFEKITVIRENGGKFLSAIADRQIYDEKGYCADSCFFDVFTFHFLEGTQTGALNEPFSIVLSKTMADKLFPGKSAMGETVTFEKKFDLKVTGVYADLPKNSTIEPSYLMSFASLMKLAGITRSDMWAGDCMNFALLKPGVDMKKLEAKIKNVFSGFKGMEYEELQLCPMKKLYLGFNGEDDYMVVLVLYGAIGIFILLMSSFNYINLTTANAATRAQEVAVKKASGSSRFMLVVQFLGETVMISLLAAGLAIVLVKAFLPVFSYVADKDLVLTLSRHSKFLGLTLLISLGVGVLSGIYPALLLSSHKITSLLKGEFIGKRHDRLSLRKILVVFQFAISVFLILITLSVSLQIRYLSRKDLGFNKESMLYTRMDVSGGGVTFSQMRDRLMRHPAILDASMSEHIPFVSYGGGMTNWEGGNPDEKINCRFNRINYDFIRNMNIRLVSGRDFSRQFPGDTGRGCLINETAARCFGWDNPIGMRLNNNRLTVVGVVKDFVYKDLHNGIEPAVMILAPEEILGNWTFAFRVDPARLGEAKAILTREFENTFPNDPFEFNYLSIAFDNENSFKIYHAVNRTLLFFTLLNVFLAMTGLLGLVSFTVIRRTKEIGVRKINGSSSLNIFCLLSREYFILLFFALLIAFPASWWAYEQIPGTNKWHVQPWVFVLAGAIIVLIILTTTGYQTLKAATRNPVEALRYE